MSTSADPRQQLRALVETLPEETLPDAIWALSNLVDDEPLSPEEEEAIRTSLDDIAAGRTVDWEEYKRRRGL
jgi:hypothetical protein